MKPLWSFLVVLLCAGSFTGAESEAQRAWRELFARSDPPKATKHINAVLSAIGDDVGKLRSLISADVAYKQFSAGWGEHHLSAASGGRRFDVMFSVRVPGPYTTEKPWPLILAVHGADGDGQTIGDLVESLLGETVEQYVIVAPTVGGMRNFAGKDYQVQAFLEPLRWTRMNLNIDDDRIYLTGYGQGGHCSWNLATMHPRLFAAAVAMGGLPYFESVIYTCDMYMENLSNLPLWALWLSPPETRGDVIHGGVLCRKAAARLKKLGNPHFKGKEVLGPTEDACIPPGDEFVDFLRSHKRQARPAKFAHFFHLPHHMRSYYLEAFDLAHEPIDFAKPVTIRLPRGQIPTKEAGMKAKRKHIAKHLFKFWGSLREGQNSCRIRAYAIRGLRMYVTDGMFDLTKAVTIKYWSKTWEGNITPSAECMLRHYAATRDQRALILNELDFTIFGKVKVRY